MAPLATIADLEAFTGQTVPAGQVAAVERLIEMVSNTVRAHCGQLAFDAGTDVEVTVDSWDGEAWLPQWPVTDVSAVESDLGPATTWSVTRYGQLTGVWPNGPITVTYSYDSTNLADIAASVVCSVVARQRVNPDGLRSEAIGGYSVTYTIPATGLGLGLSSVDRDALKPCRRTGLSMKVPNR